MGFKNLVEVETERNGKRLYVTDWFERLGFADQVVARRIGVSRETVFRWRREPHRLNAPKLSLLASVLGVEPQDFWFHPDEPSIDYRMRALSSTRKAEVLLAIRNLLEAE
jgi:transcriptional regulator with XRE-family HTH domain